MSDPPAGKSFSDYLSNISMSNSLFFSPVSSEQIEDIISSLKSRSSNISTYYTMLIKPINYLLSPLLSIIINKSLTHGVFLKFLRLRTLYLYKNPVIRLILATINLYQNFPFLAIKKKSQRSTIQFFRSFLPY